MSRADAKTRAQHEQAAKDIAAGVPIRKALLDAGYSESLARQGRKAIESSKGLRDAIKHELRGKFNAFMDMGSSFSPVEQEHIARGRLLQNVMEGSDAGVQSAKLLWQDKRVNQLVPEMQLGMIMISGGKAVPEPEVLEGEIVEAKRLTD